MLNKKKKNEWVVMRSSFIARLFVVLIPQGLFVLFAMFLWLSTDNNFLGLKYIANNYSIIVAAPITIMYASVLPIISEYMIRRERRKYGLPIYRAVTPDMITEAEVAREYRAKQNLGINESSGAVDKTDIRYWHGLLKDGIIDQKEFDKKKKELV